MKRPTPSFPASVPAAARELGETLPAEADAPRRRATCLFVHGLLEAEAERRHPGHEARREARLRAILDHLDAPAPNLDDLDALAMPAHPSRLRVWLGAAAAMLLAFVGVLFWSHLRSAEVSGLLALASEVHGRGLHVYEGGFDGPRGHLPFSLALAGEGRIQLRLERPRGPIDLGSSGRWAWFRTPTQPKAVQLPFWEIRFLLDSMPSELAELGPELPYLEVEALLAQVLTGDGLRIVGRERDAEGRELVALEGRYRLLLPEPRSQGHRSRARTRPVEPRSRERSGTVRLSLERDSGWIHDIEVRDDRRGHAMQLHRLASFGGPDAADLPSWIDFEPECVPPSGGYRLWSFFGKLAESVRREVERRREARTPTRDR